jgi:hypothetical protein
MSTLSKFIKYPEGYVHPEDKADEEIDYSELDNKQLKKLVFNQIIKQSLAEIPQASILLLASKLVGLEAASKDENDDSLKGLTTEELIEHVKKYTI